MTTYQTNAQWKKNVGVTYVDDGQPLDPKGRSSQRYTTSEQPATRQTRRPTSQPKTTRVRPTSAGDVLDDMDDEYFIRVTPVEDEDMSIGPDYAPKPYRRPHTDSDPDMPYVRRRVREENVRTAPSQRRNDERTVRVDVQQRGKKPFSFYVKAVLATGAVIMSIVAWITIPQTIHHYHVGDNPVHQYTVVMDGDTCDATAYLNGNKTAIDIIITPQDKKSKATPEARYALNDGQNHEITLQTNMDVNGDGKSDIIVLADGRQVGVLLASKNGDSFEWSKQ